MALPEMPAGTLEHVVAGDGQALETVVALFRPRLLRYATRLTYDEHAAEDAVQEAMIRFWTRAHTIRGDRQVSAWLFAVTHNALVSHRRLLRSSEVPLDPADLISEPVPETVELQDADDPYSAERVLMQQALVQIGETSRAMLLMRAGGYPYKRISRELNIPIGTVKSRLAHAKSRVIQIARRLGWQGR